jgi:hypothetical protein
MLAGKLVRALNTPLPERDRHHSIISSLRDGRQFAPNVRQQCTPASVPFTPGFPVDAFRPQELYSRQSAWYDQAVGQFSGRNLQPLFHISEFLRVRMI